MYKNQPKEVLKCDFRNRNKDEKAVGHAFQEELIPG